jgi:hypothetical protein
VISFFAGIRKENENLHILNLTTMAISDPKDIQTLLNSFKYILKASITLKELSGG